MRRLAFAIFLVIANLSWISVPTFANNPTDQDGYIQNWPGNVVLQFNSNFLPISSRVQPLFQVLSQTVSPSAICTKLRDALASQLKGSLSGWDSCSVGGTPELRGKMLGPNQLGLKIIFSNVSFSFDFHTGTVAGSPTINVTTNLELNATINFGNSIEGDPSDSTNPASVGSASFGFSNANVGSNNLLLSVVNTVSDLIGGPTLSQLGGYLNQQQFNQTSAIQSQINQVNLQLQNAASLLGGLIRGGALLGMPGDPGANNFFLLTVTIDPNQNLVFNFQRNGTSPTASNNCFGSSLSYATVEVMCYSYDMNGMVSFDATDPMLLQRQDPASNSWTVADNGISNSWDNPPPRFSVPFFLDEFFQSVPNPPKTANYRVCTNNQWGANCGATITVNLDLTVQPVVSPGSTPFCGPGSIPFRRCMVVAPPPQAFTTHH